MVSVGEIEVFRFWGVHISSLEDGLFLAVGELGFGLGDGCVGVDVLWCYQVFLVVLNPGVACSGGWEEDGFGFRGFLGEFVACVHCEAHSGHDFLHDSDAFDCFFSCVEEGCAVVHVH